MEVNGVQRQCDGWKAAEVQISSSLTPPQAVVVVFVTVVLDPVVVVDVRVFVVRSHVPHLYLQSVWTLSLTNATG